MHRHDEGFFSGKDDVRLYWESEAPDAEPKAFIGLVHGFADHLGRLRRTTEALVAAGYAVHAYDARGHGKSDGRRGHVNAFTDYVEDLQRFHDRLQSAAAGKPVFLLAHSNGGLVTLKLLERPLPGLRGLILSSPFLGLAFKPPAVKVLGARVLTHVLPILPLSNELKYEDLSRDEAWQKATAADPLYGKTVTPRWFMEAQATQAQVLQGAARIAVPTLMFVGSEDRIANAAVSRVYFEGLGSTDKQYKEYPGMRHETLNEQGKEEVWRDIVRWISAHH